MGDERLKLRLKGPGLAPFRTLEGSTYNTGYNNYNSYGGGDAADTAYWRFVYNFCMQPSASAINNDVYDGKWLPSIREYVKCPLAYGPHWQSDYGGAYGKGYAAQHENGMNAQLSSCPVLNDEAGFSDGMGNLMPTGPGANPNIRWKTLPSWDANKPYIYSGNGTRGGPDGFALWEAGNPGFNPCQDRFALAAHAIADSKMFWRKTNPGPSGIPDQLTGKVTSGNDQGAKINVESVTQAEVGEFRFDPFFPSTYRNGPGTVSTALVSFDSAFSNFRTGFANTKVYWYCRSGIQATGIGPTTMRDPTANDGFTCAYSLKSQQIPNYDAIQTFAANGDLSDASTLSSLEKMVSRYCSVAAKPGAGLGAYPRLIDGGRTSKYYAEICDRDAGFQFLNQSQLKLSARKAFRTNVYDQASGLFCKENPAATVCKCINGAQDPTFEAYRREYAAANVPTGVEACWWVPCMMRSYQSDRFLVPSSTRNQPCQIKFPSLLCVNVLKVDGKDTAIKNLYVNQENRCVNGAGDGTRTPSPAPPRAPKPDRGKWKEALEGIKGRFLVKWDTLTPIQQKAAMLIAIAVVLYLILPD